MNMCKICGYIGTKEISIDLTELLFKLQIEFNTKKVFLMNIEKGYFRLLSLE